MYVGARILTVAEFCILFLLFSVGLSELFRVGVCNKCPRFDKYGDFDQVYLLMPFVFCYAVIEHGWRQRSQTSRLWAMPALS